MARTPFEQIGERDYGQRPAQGGNGGHGELWYHCAITGMLMPSSATIIEDDPTSPYIGMRVGVKFRDEPSYATHELLRPPLIPVEEEG
jgi:hypothetical protein